MIPEELRSRNQWVGWKLETRKAKPTKVPYSPTTGRRASSTDSNTWGSYRQALACVAADGIGFVFSKTDPYCGVDLDKCVSRSGALHHDAYQIVRSLSGYVEFSPSGTGLHIIVRGSLPRGRRTCKTPWRGDIELYDRARFFTMSDDGRGQIRDSQEALMDLVSLYFPDPVSARSVGRPKPVSGDDARILDRVYAEPRIAALWRGETADHGGDSSAADMALVAHLLYFTGSDQARVDALFRRSGLMRDKWDSMRGDVSYGRQTIERALRGNA